MSLTRLSLGALINKGVMNLIGAGDLFTTGSVFYVDSNNGSDGNVGTDPAFPKASIDNAVSACTANRGDIIVAMPNHTETVTAAAGLDLDVADISVLGLGSGSSRPTVNFTTSTAADMDVGAADVTVKNLLFTCNINNQTAAIDVNSADFTMIDCELRDGGVNTSPINWIDVASAAHRFTVDGLVVRGARVDADGSVATAILLNPSVQYPTIRNATFDGIFSSGAIADNTDNTGSGSVGGIRITDVEIRTWSGNDIGMSFSTALGSTGQIGPRVYISLNDDAANITEAINPGACRVFTPIEVVNADAEKSLEWNGAESTD